MKSDASYKYDVAFSFMARDEALAEDLARRFTGKFETFIYSKRQEEIAGTDGEVTFSNVFREQARAVIILHRNDWGNTRWTRIEKNAIKSRAFDSEVGYEFALFVALDLPPKLPMYVPPTYIWVNYDSVGAQATAAVIEAHVIRQGALGRAETALERADRLLRERAVEQRRQQLHRLEEGVRKFDDAFGSILTAIESTMARGSMRELGLKLKRHHRMAALVGTRPALKVEWTIHYGNSLEDAELRAELWDGHPEFPGAWIIDSKLKSSRTYAPDFDAQEEPIWRPGGNRSRAISSAALAEDLMMWLLDGIHSTMMQR